VAAAVDGKQRGLVDHWLHPIREIAHDHKVELAACADARERLNRLCELNVVRQVRNVASDVFVQDAWARGQQLSVHGWVYSLSNGLVTDLNVTVAGRYRDDN
jgi:carbonic anhydrase